MTFTTVILYPNEPNVSFDTTYYLQNHMTLVDRVWKKYGLLNWNVKKYTAAFDGTPPQFVIGTTVEWESEEAVQNALKDPESATVFGDVPNFTNVKPISLAGTDA